MWVFKYVVGIVGFLVIFFIFVRVLSIKDILVDMVLKSLKM